MVQLRRLSEQAVVVMGASSGIGRETALSMAAEGAAVVVSARDEAGLRSLVDEITAGGGRALAVPAEVGDFAQVDAVAQAAVDTFGGLDTWVQLAANAVWARVEDTTPEEFRRVIEVTLLGQVHGVLAALPRLRARGGGSLICVSSVEARRALPYHGAYSAAKHGVDGLLEALRVELREEGAPISVTQVLPSSMNTPFFEKARSKLRRRLKPIPPVYPPSAVAEVIVRAAEYPAREVVVGRAGHGLLLAQKVAPRLVDAVLTRVGFRLQHGTAPPDPGDNLDGPVPGRARVEGPFTVFARETRAGARDSRAKGR